MGTKNPPTEFPKSHHPSPRNRRGRSVAGGGPGDFAKRAVGDGTESLVELLGASVRLVRLRPSGENEPDGTLEEEVVPRPVDENNESVAEAN